MNKFHQFMISIFFALSSQACDYSLSPDNGQTLGCYCSARGKTVCINSSSHSYYLVFNKVEKSTVIKHYHAYEQEQPPYFDYEAIKSSMLYAIHSNTYRSSYQFKVVDDSCNCISSFIGDLCPDGVLITNGASQTINFESSLDNYYNLDNATKKCIFISDVTNFSLKGDFSTNGISDKICMYYNREITCIMNKGTLDLSVGEKNRTVLLQINTFENLKKRGFTLYITGNSDKDAVYYGSSSVEPSTPIPLPTRYNYIETLSMYPIIALSVSTVFFIFSCIVLFKVNMCCGRCSGANKGVQLAKMPSELITS